MFVRKKKNSSGSVSVQIISKNNNKYKVVETIGCGRNEFEVEQLLQNAKNRLIELEPNLFDFMNYNNQKLTNKDMRVIGDELIFGKLFKDLGCENILFKKEEDKEIFKALVVSRLLYRRGSRRRCRMIRPMPSLSRRMRSFRPSSLTRRPAVPRPPSRKTKIRPKPCSTSVFGNWSSSVSSLWWCWVPSGCRSPSVPPATGSS